MESCFRFSILEFVFGKYLYIFFSRFFRLNDGQTLCERNVGDCFIATYGLPKSCVLCTGSGGSEQVLKRGGVENGLEVRCQIVLPFTHRPQRHPLNEGRSETDGGSDWWRTEILQSILFSFSFFFLDTQSSLKLTTVYAVLEDSHWGGPVLLERLKGRRHTHNNINTENIKSERKRGIMGRNVVSRVYMQHNITSERPTYERTRLYSSHLMPDDCTCFILQPYCIWVTQELHSRSRYLVSAKLFWQNTREPRGAVVRVAFESIGFTSRGHI